MAHRPLDHRGGSVAVRGGVDDMELDTPVGLSACPGRVGLDGSSLTEALGLDQDARKHVGPQQFVGIVEAQPHP